MPSLILKITNIAKVMCGLLLIMFSSSSFAQNETSVLFIGNSLTFGNDMPKMVSEIATAQGKSVIFDTVIKKGMTIQYHSEQTRTYKKIKSRKWSYVVVQGHSTEFVQTQETIDENTLPYLRKIIDSIRRYSSCTKIILYETWGYKYGLLDAPNAENYTVMQNQIKLQTMRVADIFSIGVCPVGEVWKSIYSKDTTLNLYTADNYHPSRTGSYVAACTFYIALFGETPYDNRGKIGINKEDRRTIEIQAAAFLLGNRSKWRLNQLNNAPVAAYDVILQNNELKLVSRATNVIRVTWYFGDGNLSKERNPKHVYKNKGTYTINQIAIGKCGSNSLKRIITVKALNPAANK